MVTAKKTNSIHANNVYEILAPLLNFRDDIEPRGEKISFLLRHLIFVGNPQCWFLSCNYIPHNLFDVNGKKTNLQPKQKLKITLRVNIMTSYESREVSCNLRTANLATAFSGSSSLIINWSMKIWKVLIHKKADSG